MTSPTAPKTICDPARMQEVRGYLERNLDAAPVFGTSLHTSLGLRRDSAGNAVLPSQTILRDLSWATPDHFECLNQSIPITPSTAPLRSSLTDAEELRRYLQNSMKTASSGEDPREGALVTLAMAKIKKAGKKTNGDAVDSQVAAWTQGENAFGDLVGYVVSPHIEGHYTPPSPPVTPTTVVQGEGNGVGMLLAGMGIGGFSVVVPSIFFLTGHLTPRFAFLASMLAVCGAGAGAVGLFLRNDRQNGAELLGGLVAGLAIAGGFLFMMRRYNLIIKSANDMVGCLGGANEVLDRRAASLQEWLFEEAVRAEPLGFASERQMALLRSVPSWMAEHRELNPPGLAILDDLARLGYFERTPTLREAVETALRIEAQGGQLRGDQIALLESVRRYVALFPQKGIPPTVATAVSSADAVGLEALRRLDEADPV
ncbi:MAG: hypothetical protein HYW02_02640 [Deltaproteobacteria bacterium]|nr:hypothetical protein [Deltaproteobacteria bacterium]